MNYMHSKDAQKQLAETALSELSSSCQSIQMTQNFKNSPGTPPTQVAHSSSAGEISTIRLQKISKSQAQTKEKPAICTSTYL